MTLSKRFSFYTLIVVLISALLVGCTSEDVDNEVTDDTDEFGAVLTDITREAPSTSDYAGVTMTLVGYELTEETAGAAAGTIIIEIEFENTTDDTVTLPFGDDSYTLRDVNGIDIVSSDTSETLINPEVPANETVNGTLEFAVTEGEATYFFQVGEYEDIEIGALPPNPS